MLQTSEELISINAPDWQIRQARKREAAARNKELEDQVSLSRWNRNLVARGYAPEPLQKAETLPEQSQAEIVNVKLEKSPEEIAALNETLAAALATVEAVELEYTFIPHPVKRTPAEDWAAALPTALIKQARKKHRRSSDKKLADAHPQLLKLGFSELDIDLARLSNSGLFALAGAQTAAARAADGYTWTESPGRPQHDCKFNMKHLRQKQAELIHNLEIALELLGDEKQGKSPYSGDESRRLRDESNKRKASWMANAMVYINGQLIPLAECGNTRYKSLAQLIGFVTALSVIAQEEGRDTVMITANAPSHMHPSSPFYDETTTPRKANRYLSKMHKAARDTIRKWKINAAGVAVKEPHKSAIPHSHIAMFHNARKLAEIRYNQMIAFMCEPNSQGKFKYSVEEVEIQLLGERACYKSNPSKSSAKLTYKNYIDPEKYLKRSPKLTQQAFEAKYSGTSQALTREDFIDGMARDLIECAYERHFIDIDRDEDTGRLVYGVGVNFKHCSENDSNGAAITSYVLTYLLKSFFISVDKLPKRGDFSSDEGYAKARKDAIKQQVEDGGELPISAWAAANGIRTYDMFGMPARSAYKAIGKQHAEINDTAMEGMRQAILRKTLKEDGTYEYKGHYEYVKRQGGLNASRKSAEFRMESELLNSNYALRPDLIRRKVLGVARYEVDVQSEAKEMILAYQHKTRIEGCFITSGHKVTEAEIKLSLAKAKVQVAKFKADAKFNLSKEKVQKAIFKAGAKRRALIPNCPRGGANAAKNLSIPPPEIQNTLH